MNQSACLDNLFWFIAASALKILKQKNRENNHGKI